MYMIELDRVLMVVPTAIALIVVVVLCNVKRAGLPRTCLYFAMTAYIGAVVAVTLFPLPIVDAALSAQMSEVYTGETAINLVPFAGLAKTVTEAANLGWWWSIAVTIIGGNVLMFVPLGIMLPLLSIRLRRLPTIAVTLVACSVAIEVAQLFVGLFVAGYLYRVVDIDDVILNVAGGLLGFALWKLGERVCQRSK